MPALATKPEKLGPSVAELEAAYRKCIAAIAELQAVDRVDGYIAITELGFFAGYALVGDVRYAVRVELVDSQRRP